MNLLNVDIKIRGLFQLQEGKAMYIFIFDGTHTENHIFNNHFIHHL